MRLEGRVALVTGAGGGLGQSICLALAAEGAAVAAAGRRAEPIEATAARVRAAGGRALPVAADVTDSAEVNQLVQATVRDLGRLDILVNSAGVFLQKALQDTGDEDWDRILDTNLKSVFLCCRAGATPMAEQGGGKIINISSIHGRVAEAYLSAHSASKFGVIGLSLALARELRPANIAVNVICPGAVETSAAAQAPLRGQSPFGRKLLPEEVARAVVFLASAEADAITGSILEVYGGTVPDLLLP